MLDLYSVLICLLIGFISYISFRSCKRPDGMPPGPFPWPILGNVLTISKYSNIVEAFRELRKQYGDVFSVKIGSSYLVIVNGYENLRDALVHGNRFNDRAKLTFFKVSTNLEGIIGPSGHLWSENRVFVQNTLKLFGFGKHSLQGKIMTEVNFMIKHLEDQNGRNVEILPIAQVTFSNIIASILYSRRHEYDDPYMKDILKRLGDLLTDSEYTGLLDMMPFLDRLPGDYFRIQKIVEGERCFNRHFQREVDEHKKDFDDSNHRDFIDVYLSEMNKQKDKASSIFTEHQLIRICRDLLLGGTDTTVTSIRWAFLHLILKPEIQVKMYKEIVDVLGTNRQPDMNDRPKMPYCEAVCYETMRVANVAPLSAPRSTTDGQDVEFQGYQIPGGTQMIPNLDSILFDEKIFPDPEEFVPERFLDGSKLSNELTKILIPFAIGKRNCPGEVLARQELFLALVSLVQRFEFLPPKDMPPLKNERGFGIIFFPPEYQMRFKLR